MAELHFVREGDVSLSDYERVPAMCDPADMKAFDRALGTRVRDFRRQIGLAPGELGSAIGVSAKQVDGYETGLNRISASRLAKISKVLAIPVAYLVDTDLAVGPNLSSEASELARKFDALGERDKNAARALIMKLSVAGDDSEADGTG